MKIVINTCFGGFGLSPAGIKRWAELKGRPCYFFASEAGKMLQYVPIRQEDAEDSILWTAFDIPNPNEVLGRDDNWHGMTLDERKAHNDLHARHSLYDNSIPRNDPDLIRIVEEMGAGHRTGASGWAADLKVVEIPDGVDYEIEEYDGNEHIAEKHRTWG